MTRKTDIEREAQRGLTIMGWAALAFFFSLAGGLVIVLMIINAALGSAAVAAAIAGLLVWTFT